ncbi:DUF1761 domain-containing protein [uncultured Algimonas sp.]|uniref:DUF1761 domain-containing protein n=1 Tax=uncultured Algimonas sp. TaxID=1547920 RepID=UPI002601FFC0|nr:DUF1761 domain-containing protein [uncultured Algimonas sp.]
MIYIVDNIVPILAATVAGFLFGGLYYRMLRGAWLRAAGPNAALAERRPGPLHYAGIFVAEFWMAAILAGAVILAPAGDAGPWTMALGSAFIIWIGFVLPTVYVSYRVLGQTMRLVAFDAAHWLAVMLIMAATVQAIGVTGPMTEGPG